MLCFKKHRISGVVFDIDGTLFDTFQYLHDIVSEELNLAGFPPISKNVLLNCISRSVKLETIISSLMPGTAPDIICFTLRDRVVNKYKQIEMDIPPFSGVEELLLYLESKKLKVGLATGRSTGIEHEWKRLSKRGLDRLVQAVVTGKEVLNPKPAPDLILQCINRLSIPPGECICVGDWIKDIAAARSAGALPVAVSTGLDKKEDLARHRPEMVMDRIDQLMSYLA